MTQKDKLKTYRSKRDFKKTKEPSGEGGGKRTKTPIFVIQKHDATQLHYDLRFEVEGVLKSWVLPKGPSTDPREKRLAIPTEDHPYDYATFEGTIPEHEYGGGTVIVWDTGTYRNLMGDKDEPLNMDEAIEAGHVEVWLEGQKLQGGYALVRTRTDSRGKAQWLFIKMRDDKADARRNPVSTQPDSVLSGRSLEEVARESS